MTAPDFKQAYADLPPLFYGDVSLCVAPSAHYVIVNEALAGSLRISRDWLHSDEALKLFSGSAAPEHGNPLAMAYAGHQFGGFSASLGDGRALLLGDYHGKEFHLKGSGPTPFSRRGDGKATLSAALREYIISEAMAGLGVPTTRTLCVVATGETIFRQKPEAGAVMTRIATSHVRVGTFQYAAVRSDIAALKALMDHEIARHCPEVSDARIFLAKAITRQAHLIAHWMSFGFIHGVMNTDNMQIAGETIDYGPCAFMDQFRPDKVFSSIDDYGRYAFNQQPKMALWNLTRFAECLLALLHEDKTVAVKIAEAELQKFMPLFENIYFTRMLAKLGIEGLEHSHFVDETLNLLATMELDFTQFFTRIRRGDLSLLPEIWVAQWQNLQTDKSAELMAQHNPYYIARNHRVEAVLAAANEGNLLPLHSLLLAVQEPFTERAENAAYENGPMAGEEVLATFCGT